MFFTIVFPVSFDFREDLKIMEMETSISLGFNYTYASVLRLGRHTGGLSSLCERWRRVARVIHTGYLLLLRSSKQSAYSSVYRRGASSVEKFSRNWISRASAYHRGGFSTGLLVGSMVSCILARSKILRLPREGSCTLALFLVAFREGLPRWYRLVHLLDEILTLSFEFELSKLVFLNFNWYQIINI